MRLRAPLSPNLSCFQILGTRAEDCLISMRSFYEVHLLTRWAYFSSAPELRSARKLA
jgi:hypothetical protein